MGKPQSISGLSTDVAGTSLREACAPSTGRRLQTQSNVEFPHVTRSLPILQAIAVSDAGALLS